MKKGVHDNVLKVLAIVFILPVLIVSYFYLREHLVKEWADFYISMLGYLFILLYLTFAFKEFKRFSQIKLFIFQFIFFVLTGGTAYFIFAFKLLPMPKSHHIYIFAAVILATISMLILSALVNKKTNGSHHDKGRLGRSA